MRYIAKAGDTTVEHGRVLIKCVDHPEFGTRWVMRSHFVWWRYRKQRVPKGWVLHHKDRDASHDVMSNLRLMTNSAHTKLHFACKEIGGAKITMQGKRRLSLLAKAQHKVGNLGTATWTEESVRKNSAAHLGQRHTAAARAKISKARKGGKVEPEVRARISKSVREHAFEEHLSDYFNNINRITQPLSNFI